MHLDLNKQEKALVKAKIIKQEKGKSSNKKGLWPFFQKKGPTSSLRKTTLDIMPYKGTIGSKEHFIVGKNKFYDLLRIVGVNFNGLSQRALWDIVYQYEALLKLYVMPFKVITIYTPLETSATQHYYAELASFTETPKHKEILMENYFEMKWLSEHKLNKEFFVLLSGETVQDLRECRKDFINFAGSIKLLPVPLKQKRELYFRLNNPTSSAFFDY